LRLGFGEILEPITARARQHEGVNVEPMQLAALLLERTTEQLTRTKSATSFAIAAARVDEQRRRSRDVVNSR
jgi:hypothetical protein